MNEYVDLTYYQKHRDLILNRVKDYYENGMKENKLVINIETYLKKKKINKKNGKMPENISICLKKRKKILKEYQKNYREAKKSKYKNK